MAKKHEVPRIVLRRDKAPLQLRGEVGSYLPPGAKYEYKPPSVFEQHRVLSIVFAVIVLAMLAYGLLAPKRDGGQSAQPTPAETVPPKDEPVYVEPIAPH